MEGKKRVAALLAFLAIIFVVPMAFASGGDAGMGDSRYDGFFSFVALACVVGLGIAAGGGGIGMGSAVSGVVGAMARNPGLYGKFFTILFIGLAFIESVVIYTLVIVLVLLYANPLL